MPISIEQIPSQIRLNYRAKEIIKIQRDVNCLWWKIYTKGGDCELWKYTNKHWNKVPT